jgi:zinc transporter 5/7
MIAASVIPLVIDTGRVLSLDMGTRDKEVQQALSEVSHISPNLITLTTCFLL